MEKDKVIELRERRSHLLLEQRKLQDAADNSQGETPSSQTVSDQIKEMETELVAIDKQLADTEDPV